MPIPNSHSKSHHAFMRLGIVLLMLASCNGALAQSQQPLGNAESRTAARPSPATLDTLLSEKKYRELGVALEATSTALRMAWLREKIFAGASSFLNFPYIRDLWVAGQSINLNDPMQDLRVTAALYTLYTYELIVIDGAKCEDRSAPGHRQDQLFQNYAPVLKYLKAQPAATKARIVDLAFKLEQKTASTRKDDDFLCRDGLAQIQAALGSGAKPVEVPTPRGQVGKTMMVPDAPNYVPNFLPAAQYQPVQQRRRSEMQARLSRLVQ